MQRNQDEMVKKMANDNFTPPSVAKQRYMNLPVNFSSLTGWRYPGIPRLKGNWLVGRLANLLSDNGILDNLIAAGQQAAQHASGMCYYWLANKLVLLVTKPEHIKHILIDNDTNVSRRTATRFIESFWGPNIAIDPNELWKKKRAVYLKHLAERDSLKQQEPVMIAVMQKYFRAIQKCEGKAVALHEIFSGYTLDNILNLMVPFDPNRNTAEFSNYTALTGEKIANIKNIFKWSLPTLLRKIIYWNERENPVQIKAHMQNTFNKLVLCPYKKHIETTDNFIHSIWELRKDQAGQAELEHNADVFGDSNTLFFTAQDTVTYTLEFAVKLLCANPDIEEKLHAELVSHLQGQEFTVERINKIEYLDMIIKEVLRLYPASPTLPPRGVDKAFKIADLPLRKGDLILISPYLTQRLTDLWEEPERFEPERFSRENSAKIPAHAYLPFSDGKHGCVGWKFAYQQIKILLAAIYLNYHVEIEDNSFDIKFCNTTIRPVNKTSARFLAR